MNPRSLTLFVVYTHFCWSLKHTVSPSRKERLGVLKNNVSIIIPGESSSVAALTDLELDSTDIQQASEAQDSTSSLSSFELPMSVPDSSTTIKLEGLVDAGSGSEHYQLLEFVASGAVGNVYKALPISKFAKERVDALYKNQATESVNGKQAVNATNDQQYVALKIIDRVCREERYPILRELRLIRHMKRHSHLVSFVSSHLQNKDNTVWIALSWVEGDKLGDIVNGHMEEAERTGKSTPTFDEDQTKDWQ